MVHAPYFISQQKMSYDQGPVVVQKIGVANTRVGFSSIMVKSKVHKSCGEVSPKSLYRSLTGRHFYGTENEIQAGFGPVGNIEKKLEADYEQLLRLVFSCIQGEKNNLTFFKRYCSVCSKKLHKMKVRKPKKKSLSFSYKF